jgi:hypothetical protein
MQHHHIFHEVIAAIGGVLFIIFGISKQRERLRYIKSGKKTEGSIVWTALIVAGACLLIFALGLIMYQLNHQG